MFEGYLGVAQYSDIAIDDVSFVDGACSAIPASAEIGSVATPPPPTTQAVPTGPTTSKY